MALFRKLAQKVGGGKSDQEDTPATRGLHVCCDRPCVHRPRTVHSVAYDRLHGLLIMGVEGGIFITGREGVNAFMKFPFEATAGPLVVVPSEGGRVVMAVSSGTALVVFDPRMRGVLSHVRIPDGGHSITSLHNALGSPHVLCGCTGGRILIFDVREEAFCQHELRLPSPKMGVRAAIVHPTDPTFLYAHTSAELHTIVQVQLHDGAIVKRYTAQTGTSPRGSSPRSPDDSSPKDTLTSYCITPDGRFLVAGAAGSLMAWAVDIAHHGHPQPVKDVPPLLTCPLGIASDAPVVGLDCSSIERGPAGAEYVMVGHAEVFGVFEVKLRREKSTHLQVTGVRSLSSGPPVVRQLVVIPPAPAMVWPAQAVGPLRHVVVVDDQEEVKVVQVPQGEYEDATVEGLYPFAPCLGDPVVECLLLPYTLEIDAPDQRAGVQWPFHGGVSGFQVASMLARADLLAARHASGEVRVWKIIQDTGEVVRTNIPLYDALEGVVLWQQCYGGAMVVCVCRGEKGTTVWLLDILKGTKQVLWRPPMILAEAPEAIPASPPEPTTSGSGADEEAASVSPEDNPTTSPKEEESDPPAEETEPLPPVATAPPPSPPVSQGPAVTSILAVPEASRLLVGYDDNTLSMVTFGATQPTVTTVPLKEFIQADAIRLLRRMPQFAHTGHAAIKVRHEEILLTAGACHPVALEMAVALVAPLSDHTVEAPAAPARSKRAKRPESPNTGEELEARWVTLVGTSGGAVYSLVVGLDGEPRLAGHCVVSPEMAEAAALHHAPGVLRMACPSKAQALRSYAANGGALGVDTITANATPRWPPLTIPTSYRMDLLVLRDVLRNACGSLLGTLQGVFGEQVLTFHLSLGWVETGEAAPVRSILLQFGHQRHRQHYSQTVELPLSALLGEEDDVEDVTTISITYDDTLALYLVMAGPVTVFEGIDEDREPSTEGGYSCTAITVQCSSSYLQSDEIRVAPPADSVHLVDLSSPFDVLNRIEVADAFSQDIGMVCLGAEAGTSCPPTRSEQLSSPFSVEGTYAESLYGAPVVLAAGHRSLCLLSVPDLTVVSKRELTAPLLSLHMCQLYDQACGLVLTSNGKLSVFGTDDMRCYLQAMSHGMNRLMPLDTTQWICATIQSGTVATESAECGVVLMDATGQKVFHGRLLGTPEVPGGSPPEASRQMCRRPPLVPAQDLQMPPKPTPEEAGAQKKGFLKTVFSSSGPSVAEVEQLLAPLRVAEEPGTGAAADDDMADVAAYAAETHTGSGAASDAAARRRELLGDKHHTPGEEDSAGHKIARAQGGVGEVHSVMAENHRLLAERGERLDALAQKTGDMQDAAKDFADAARRLNQQYQNKKWYQL